jgi:hypothetical protein
MFPEMKEPTTCVEESTGGTRYKGGALRRIVLLATVAVAIVAAMLTASALSVSAQSTGQYAPATGQAVICAPWSKAWDISKGKWYFQWYRWCYDPATSDPSSEASWYTEQGSWQWADKVNLCPGSGTCTMTTQ